VDSSVKEEPLMLIRDLIISYGYRQKNNPGKKIKLLETPKAYSTKQLL
jgi:hypothetical protein